MKLILLLAASLALAFPVLALAQHGTAHDHGRDHGHDHGHDDGHGHHGHGHGLDPDSGALEHWLPRLEEEGRAAWQKPDHVAEILGLEPGMSVADVGAGTGYFLASLVEAVGPKGRVYALDIAPDLVQFMTERAREHGWSNVTARTIEPDDPGLAAGPVDRILIVNTWHHFSDRTAYAAKLMGGLRPDGAIYSIDYTLDSPHGPPVDHRMPAAKVIEEMEAAGLRAELVEEEDLPYQYVVVARRP